jgi:micrococcal nuclease
MMATTQRTVALAGVTLLAVVAAVAVGFGPATAAIEGGDEAVVTNVVDGDTVDVRFPDGTTDRVRFKGIDTPESGSTQSQPQEYDGASGTCLKNEGNELTEWMRHLEGEEVTLRYDTEGDRRGYFDRRLAYVYFEGTNYNFMLVETGRARVTTEYPMSNQSRYTAAESGAKSVNRGLWRCTDAGGSAVQSGDGAVDVERVVPASAADGGNLTREHVVLENSASENSGNEVDLAGWTLDDDDGYSYTFDEGVALEPNETLVLYTGTGSDDADRSLLGTTASDTGDRDRVYWSRSEPVWNDGFENVTLETADGQLASSRFYRHAPVEAATNDASDVNWTDRTRDRTRNASDLESVTGTFQGSDDGDTVTVTVDGTDRPVDLVGVVWPKSSPYKKGFENVPDNAYGGHCLKNEAAESDGYPLYERMSGKEVTLYFDPVKGKRDDTGYDANGNLHAYLHFRGEDINRKLLAEGAARMHYGQFLRNPEYSTVEARARQANRDVWRCQRADKGGIGRVDVETISADPEGPDYANLGDEFVVLENLDSSEAGTSFSTSGAGKRREPVDLSGWTVTDADGNSYTFGNVTLEPGEKVVLRTGKDPGATSVDAGAGDLAERVVEGRYREVYWGRSTAVWDNDADTVTVTAPDGRVATTRTYEYLSGRSVDDGVDLEASGARSDDGDLFTQGQTNRVDVTVTGFDGPSTRVAVNDSVPEGWRVLPAGDAGNSGDVRTVELGTVTRAELEEAKANGESGVTLTYFVEATGSTPRGTFGPATATALDGRDAYDDPTAEFGGTDAHTVVPASSET